jgi:hypothetical protein
MAALATAPSAMTLGDALTTVGTWQAALAVGSDQPWRRLCGDAVRNAQCPRTRTAWAALARSGRTDVAARLYAAGIHT